MSHHPPVAAFYLRNNKAGVHLNGHCGQKTKFTGTSIQVEQTGCLFIFIEKYNEEYAISLPELYLRGIVSGAPFVELTGETLIVSSSHKIAAKIRFIPKPWFSGEYNLVEGIIFDDSSKDILFEIWGKWSKKTFIQSKEDDPKENHLANIESGVIDEDPSSNVLFDVEGAPIEHPKLSKDQSPLESRQVWLSVTNALVSAQYEEASRMKNEIEEKQRDIRKERAANGIEWLPLNFGYLDKFFMGRSQDDSLEHLVSANLSTESLIRLKNLDIQSDSNKSDSFEDSVASTSTLERAAVEKIKFVGRYVAYEFLDLFEKKIDQA